MYEGAARTILRDSPELFSLQEINAHEDYDRTLLAVIAQHQPVLKEIVEQRPFLLSVDVSSDSGVGSAPLGYYILERCANDLGSEHSSAQEKAQARDTIGSILSADPIYETVLRRFISINKAVIEQHSLDEGYVNRVKMTNSVLSELLRD